MTNNLGTFPFGQPVQRIAQQDRSPKKVFVLGVYASAVHARWIGPDGKKVVTALAVASEPCIFWTGDSTEAESIISRIPIDGALGKLRPAADMYNGPSGRNLDDLFLTPLGYNRDEAWLCDLVPYSCLNPRQRLAIDTASKEFTFPQPTMNGVPDSFADDVRRNEILAELLESKAKLLVLLGDQPIRHFLKPLDKEHSWTWLRDIKPYGQRHRVRLGAWEGEVLPLCHPRQAGREGKSSEKWAKEHEEWTKKRTAHERF